MVICVCVVSVVRFRVVVMRVDLRLGVFVVFIMIFFCVFLGVLGVEFSGFGVVDVCYYLCVLGF